MSAPSPNAHRQPASGHPAGTQRVQRLGRSCVAGIGVEDCSASQALCCLRPCRQPLHCSFTLGGSARIALALRRLEYRRLRQPPMLRGWMFQRYAFFLCPSAEKRDRCLVLNITGIVCRAETAIPSEMTIIFNTAISYVSAPSSRQSCRREHSSLHPCQGWKRLFPPLAGYVLPAHLRRVAPPTVRSSLGSCPLKRAIPFLSAVPAAMQRTRLTAALIPLFCTPLTILIYSIQC